MRKTISLVSVLACLCWTVMAQSGVATKNVQPSETRFVLLTNRDVLDLLKTKMTPEELVARIKVSTTGFDISPAALKSLQNAGVTSEVIVAMVQASEVAAKDQPANDSQLKKETIAIPAGTMLDVEASYTLNSVEIKPGELLSFRVLIPVKINDRVVIEKGAVVTGRVVEAKAAGHWGHAGRLVWTMRDVVAVDGTRVPIAVVNDSAKGTGRSTVKGTSHAGEVATKTLVTGVLLAPVFPIAPLALMHGFKRGEEAVLPEGKRLVVFVTSDTSIKLSPDR